ncbi:MAG: phage major capsid protein [Holosporales bacterium]
MTQQLHPVEEMNQSFAEFKATQTEYQADLEHKGRADGLYDAKLERINHDIERAYDCLKNLELAARRPLLTEAHDLPHGWAQHKSAFLNYVRKGDEASLLQLEAKSLSAASDADGGYAIPQVLHERLQTTLDTLSPMRRLASVMTVSSSAVDLLVNQNQADAGWAAETDARNPSETPKLGKVRIPVHELYARPRATQKLLDDAVIDVESWLMERIALRLAQLENQAFLRGDGQNKPKGILSYESVPVGQGSWGKFEALKTGVNGAFAEENPADVLLEAVAALEPRYLNGATWLMSRSALAACRKLKDQNGHYLWQPGLGGSATSTLLGHTVEVMEEMPAVLSGQASVGIVFGHFREAYQIVDRQDLRVLRDPYSAKPYVEFYTSKRVGGDVINFDALKWINFAE